MLKTVFQSVLMAILFIAIITAIMMIVIMPMRWFFGNHVDLDEVAVWFVIGALLIAVFLQARNQGAIYPVDEYHTWIIFATLALLALPYFAAQKYYSEKFVNNTTCVVDSLDNNEK